MGISRRLPIALLLLLGACGDGEGGPGGEPAEQPAPPPPALPAPDSATGSFPADSLPPAGGDPTIEPGIDPVPAAPSTAPGDAGSATAAQPTPSGSGSTRASRDEPAASAGDAEAVLLRAERAYDAARTFRASFVQDLTVPLLASTQRSRGQIFHRKPDRFLMRFSDPAGDLVVADGRYLWLFYPSSDPKQVIRTSVGEAGRLDLQREFLSNPTERYAATLHGTEAVNGRPAHSLTLVPRTASPYRQVKIWIDTRDFLARRFEITESNDAVRRVELQNLEVNVTLPDSLFAFTPPAGTQVFDQ